MATAQVCPVIGATANVLPPHHPEFDRNDANAVCPVTNAKVGHHGTDIIHEHPADSHIPSSDAEANNAQSCPALKNANKGDSLTEATCPVVGPVSAVLPPTHPSVSSAEAGAVCPVTNATLEHHKGKLHEHPSVSKSADPAACPVVGAAH